MIDYSVHGVKYVIPDHPYAPLTRTMIVENFVPLDEAERITPRAMFDEDDDKWRLKPFEPIR